MSSKARGKRREEMKAIVEGVGEMLLELAIVSNESNGKDRA